MTSNKYTFSLLKEHLKRKNRILLFTDTWVHSKSCNACVWANSHERRRKNIFFCARHDAISEKFTSCLHHTSLRRKRRHACVVPPVPTVCIVNSQANNTHSLHYVCTGVTTHACLRFLLNDVWCKQDVKLSEIASWRAQKKLFFSSSFMGICQKTCIT